MMLVSLQQSASRRGRHASKTHLITCALLAGALSLAVPAYALGLGKLTVESGLGQPLSAQIELTPRTRMSSIPSAQESPIRRSIAKTARNTGALSRARITVERGRNGAHICA